MQDIRQPKLLYKDITDEPHFWVDETHDVVHTEELARPAVQHWIDYVREDKCGWIDEWWNAETPAYDRHQAAKVQAADIRYNLAKDTAQGAMA